MSAALEIGSRHGDWIVMQCKSDGRYRVRCTTCDSQTDRSLSNVLAARMCRACGEWGGLGNRTPLPIAERAREITGMPEIDFELRTDADPVALAAIRLLAPLTLEEIGAAMGVSKERVRQIEEAGLRKVAVALAEAGCSESDVREWLMRARPAHVLDVSPESGSPDDDRPRIRDAVDREGYDAPGRAWERGLDRAGRPERIAAVGFESELGLALERAVAVLEVEAEMAALAATMPVECAEAAE